MTLDEHLSACARASGLRENAVSVAHGDLARAIATHPDLASEARTRLAAINPSVLLRDHASRWLKATLERAIGTPHE